MTSRSKEKVAAAFRKLFRSSSKMNSPDRAAGSSGGGSESPARRLLRHGMHRDAVQPVEGPTESPNANRGPAGFFKSKKVGASGVVSDMKQSSSGHQQKVRSRRLMKEFKDAQRLETQNGSEPPFTVELVNDNLFEWHVRLYRVDTESELAADMRELGIPCILLHLLFPDNFPFSPPFMRVISPRIDKGFVMEGGAICMELLTPRGWASAYTIEAVIMQFAASLVKGQVCIGMPPDLSGIHVSVLPGAYCKENEKQRLQQEIGRRILQKSGEDTRQVWLGYASTFRRLRADDLNPTIRSQCQCRTRTAGEPVSVRYSIVNSRNGPGAFIIYRCCLYYVMLHSCKILLRCEVVNKTKC